MANNRDIMQLQGTIHPDLLKILLSLNSDIHVLRQHMSSAATMLNQLADVMGQQQVVAENFKPYIDKLKAMGMSVGSDPTITGEVDDDK